MVQDWLFELLIGTGKLLLNPVFYLVFLLAAYLGVSRVKRERKNFTVRVENAYFELRQLLPVGLLVGVVLSIFILAIGVVVPLEVIVLAAAITFLFILTARVRLLSAAYTFGFASIGLFIMDWLHLSLPFMGNLQLTELVFPAIVGLLAFLLIGEGFVILANGPKGTSPKLINGKRGHTVGVHELKRVWLLPVFLLIPGNGLQESLSWWPVLSFGGETYSLLLVPFAVGIQQQVQAVLPRAAIKLQGKRVVILGMISLLFAVALYFLPIFNVVAEYLMYVSLGVVVIISISRALITYVQCNKESSLPFYFSKQNNGLMILGILLNSPASKMDLKVGEIITKVNGQPVQNQTGFYEALQRNRAHCRLEVLDANREVRFVQRALYEGDHHELGILFVHDEKKKGIQAV